MSGGSDGLPDGILEERLSPPPTLDSDVSGGPAPILRWTLDRPRQRNAVGPDVFAWICARSKSLDGEVVILRGGGDVAFCAGFDLHALRRDAGDASTPPDHSLIAATDAMLGARATFIASVNGYAIGAGVELAASCDFRVACAGASFRIPAGILGVVYHVRGLDRIHSVFGSNLAHRLFLAGERICAQEAMAAGALHSMVDLGALEAHTMKLATAVAALAPLSVAGNRQLLRALDRRALQPDLVARHEEARAHAYASEDHAHARTAMAEKRPPRFRGR